MKEITLTELKKYGFDIDYKNTQASAFFYDDDTINYFEYNSDILEELKNYDNPVLELVVNYSDEEITGFSYAYGPSVNEAGIYKNDDLEGVILWLRERF